MNMRVLVATLLLGACASSTPQQAPTEAPKSELQADSTLQARQQFRNQGGMWLPTQMGDPVHAEAFRAMGVSLTAKDLSDPLAAPLGAVVSLLNCTGSFVSPQGLVVTNHHCVQGALQHNSKPGDNLVEKGFLAKTLAEEKSAGPAARVMVAEAIKDVTKDMRDGLEAIKDPIARKKESESRSKKLVAACEKDRLWMRCTVHSYFRGGKSELIEYLEIKDVRLVYVPQRSVGNYGGEIDNWAWPRHTGDFSFYRAYVGKDGKPADFSPENVPYQPKHVLKVSVAPLKASDFVMVTGYPGRTERLDTAQETKFDSEVYTPYLVEALKARYAVAEELIKGGGETAIKAGVMKQGIQNGLEKYEGQLKGLKDTNAAAKKAEDDARVREWAKTHEKENADITKLDALIAETQKTEKGDLDRNLTVGSSALLRTALTVVRLVDERQKPDMERKPGFQDRDMPRTMAAQKQMSRSYDKTLDRAMLKLSLTRALALPEAERPWLATLVGSKKLDQKALDAWVEKLYKNTKLEDEATRVALVSTAKPADLRASKDPFVQAAAAYFPILKAAEEREDRIAGDMLLVAPAYVEGLRATAPRSLSPDANSTLRITYGTILPPPDKKSAAFTKASEILAKDTGVEPFDAPKLELEKIKAKQFGPYIDAALGDLPVDFMSDLDITGGNSGSPTLNSKGEFVGLAFDGTIEGVSSDVVFNVERTRTIHVDARYMAWIMDAIDQADNILTEIGITPSL